MAERQKRKVSALCTEDLTGAEVPRVLAAYRARSPRQHRHEELPSGRDPQFLLIRRRPGTPPCQALRGSAARSFQTSIKKAMCYLESAEVAAILSQPDQSTAGGQRDHTLLSLLYNTGARIQEALDLRPQDIHLKSPAHLRLMGKGQKETISPLCPETAEVVAALLRRSPRRAEEPVFEPEYHRSVATLAPRLWNKCSASSREKPIYPERGGGRPPLTEKGVRASMFSRYRRSRLSLK